LPQGSDSEAAEAAACSLGTKIAQVAAAAQIQIFLRDGALGGRYVCTSDRSFGWRSRDP
jgi:hypothetical protein